MACGKSGGVCESGLPRHRQNTYVLYILLSVGCSLHMGHSYRRGIGGSFNDVFKDGLVTAPRREVLASGDTFLPTPTWLQEVAGAL